MKKIIIMASTIALICIVGVILINIVARSIFNSPISWSFELTSILIIWSVYLVFGVNYQDKKHFRIDILKEKLNDKVRKILDIFSDLIILTTLLIIIYFSISAIKINIAISTMALNFPVALAYYLPVLIGSVSMILYLFSKYIKLFKAR